MNKRDWQKDWMLAQRIRTTDVWHLPDSAPRQLTTTQPLDYVCAANSLYDWLLRVRELEDALQLALCVLTEGMADVLVSERYRKCAEMRAEAKRAIRQVLGMEEETCQDGQG